MKKLFLLTATLLFCTSITVFSQNYVSVYGYQFSSFKATGAQIFPDYHLEDVEGKINHSTLKGEVFSGGLYYAADISNIMLGAIRGGGAKMNASYYGGSLDLKLGGMVGEDELKFGAAIDVGFRGFRYSNDTTFIIDEQRSYWVTGLTMLGKLCLGERLFIVPKFSIDPVKSRLTEKRWDGMTMRFEMPISFGFAGPLGISINPGFERMNMVYEAGEVDGEMTYGKTNIVTRYLQIGLIFALD